MTAVLPGRCSILEYEAYPDRTNNFAEASFAGLLPIEGPQAILFVAGGTDSDARPWLKDPHWRTLAEKERLMLVAACLRGGGEAYENASEGSGQALLDAIAAFAKQSDRLELLRLPIILYGHSAGAQFGFSFACWKPDRVRAIICVKSGPLQTPPKDQIPPFQALFIAGERDHAGRIREAARAYTAGRAMGARWSFALQPNAGHGTSGCQELVDSFISAVLLKSDSLEYAKLSDKSTTAAPGVAETDPEFTWLPNQAFAKQWRQFAKDSSLQELTKLPDESPETRLLWRAVNPLPEQIEQSNSRVSFEYAVSTPASSGTITRVTVNASHPAIKATTERITDRDWGVRGSLDLSILPLGSFKSVLETQSLTTSGDHIMGKLHLFTRLTGPISISRSSIYYGVLPRDRTAEFDVEIRSKDHQIDSCEAVSSDPSFATVAVSKSGVAPRFQARCTIQSGSRIGTRNGEIIFHVKAGEEYQIRLPYYGFVKK